VSGLPYTAPRAYTRWVCETERMNSTTASRLGNLFFWTLVAGGVAYIFFWPNETLNEKLLKGFLGMLLFGMAYADSQQKRVKEIEKAVASLEAKVTGLEKRLDEIGKSEERRQPCG
jgi:hypothetical protein